MNSLGGQKLIRFSFRSRGDDCVFEFDLGGALHTHAAGADYDQWTLFEPSGFCLALRGDKSFSYHRSDKPVDPRSWKSVYQKPRVSRQG
jgi:hypothetical protein